MVGSVSFVSKAARGDMSDVEIVRRSPGRIGILDNLEKGDVVMADKGFRDKSDFLLKGLQTSNPRI